MTEKLELGSFRLERAGKDVWISDTFVDVCIEEANVSEVAWFLDGERDTPEPDSNVQLLMAINTLAVEYFDAKDHEHEVTRGRWGTYQITDPEELAAGDRLRNAERSLRCKLLELNAGHQPMSRLIGGVAYTRDGGVANIQK